MAGVAHIPYLAKRPSGFFFRRRFPGRLAEIPHHIHGSALCLSLRTDVLSEARPLTRALTALCDLGFAMMTERPVHHLNPQNFTLLSELARFQIAAHEASRACAEPRSEEAANFAVAVERNTQDVLRQALALGDRAPAIDPLREISRRFGVTLDEGSPEWRSLAFEALRVMLDTSRERERRELGVYRDVTPVFRSLFAKSARADLAELGLHGVPGTAQEPDRIDVLPDHAASRKSLAPSIPAAVPASPRQQAEPIAEIPGQEAPQRPRPTPATFACETPLPEPRVLVDQSLLSDASRAALQKGPNIEMREAFTLYHELKVLGYGDNFGARQKRFPDKGAKWDQTSGLNAKNACKIWLDVLGNQPFSQIHWTEVDAALNIIQRLPKYHGIKPNLINTKGYLELVERADEMEITEKQVAIARLNKSGKPTPAQLEQAGLDALIPRLRVATFLRHGRMANRVGKMLHAMKIIPDNPFEICSWSNDEEKDMKAMQDDRSRMLWDDRIQKLFASPVFQGGTKEPGDQIFWTPLIARLCGTRMEEVLQLRPDDFEREDGIDYFWVRNIVGNTVKSTAGERRVPVHPKLIEFGLLRLVELRLSQDQPRLFPNLKRGQTKTTFSELFTKTFGYYRKTNGCYWPGLDFHALRTTFHNDLVDHICPDLHRRRLMGHEGTVDEGDASYTKHLKIGTLHKIVSQIDVDTSAIVSPFSSEAQTRVIDGNVVELRSSRQA